MKKINGKINPKILIDIFNLMIIIIKFKYILLNLDNENYYIWKICS